MNKKFSTLVASLLFASAFSAYAGTPAQMLSNPTGIETRAVVPSKDAVKGTDAGLEAAATAVKGALKGFTNNARLQVFEAADGSQSGADYFVSSVAVAGAEADYTAATTAATMAPFYFTLDGDKLVGGNNVVLSLDGEQNFDIVPLTKQDGTATSFFALRVVGGANDGKYVSFTKGSGAAGTFAANTASAATDAAIFASVETAYTTAAKGEDLNAELKDGFTLAVTYGNKALTGAELFASKLTAVKTSDLSLAGTETTFALKTKGNKYLVFDETMNSTNAVKGGFKLVDETAVKAAIAAGGAATFSVKQADNGVNSVEVTVDTNKRLYVNVSNGTNVLTALNPADLGNNAANWAGSALGASNTLDFNTLLTGQFYKVSYVKTGEEDQANAYKINGVLGLRFNATASPAAVEDDFVKAVDFVAEDPSTMWAPSIDGNNLVLTNRENTEVEVSIAALREVRAGVYEATVVTSEGIADNDLVTITAVSSVTKTDGYAVYADQVLTNSAFYLGQSRRNADGDVPAYWAENHGTHQIGATVSQDDATQWNVELIKKTAADYNKQIDSVLVVSSLYAYNAKTGVITEIADTLAVLPYVFQNRDNREYVKLNDQTNLEYYICDKDNKNTPRSAQIFALKKKPGNTYNYVTLALNNAYTDGAITPVNAITGADKVYLKNSESRGAWENIATYADDANSLMVVEPIDAPEYRKVVAAWGDTVRIYREEYPTEVLFEKRDAKSVVDGETLSFLNVNNSVSGANPAIFVDTAYVNRTVNGVENTCYQYLLAVNVDKENSYYCPYNPEHNTAEWRKEHNGPCADALENRAVKGRFLINLIDTAYAYKQDHLHNNPYINMVEADENLAKLSFVEGTHANDTLYITRKGGEVVKLGMTDPRFNVAKFAFRYVNNEAGSFKIQTQYKNYNAADLDAFNASASNEGYLRWVNGTVVVTNQYTNGETFNMEENYAGNPTANENAPEVSTISVVATNGGVIVKGAEGKNVVITNVLGQTIANTTISSSEATIAAPAGVVVVAVEGEAAVKAIVK